jgi:hypothetical protein
MTEGTEDAETQEPSIYKDFGQKVRLVRYNLSIQYIKETNHV